MAQSFKIRNFSQLRLFLVVTLAKYVTIMSETFRCGQAVTMMQSAFLMYNLKGKFTFFPPEGLPNFPENQPIFPALFSISQKHLLFPKLCQHNPLMSIHSHMHF